MVPLDRLLGHFRISALGWLAGMVAGIALGYALALISLRIAPPGRRRGFVATIVPWRTLLAGLVLLNMLPLAVVWMLRERVFTVFNGPWEALEVASIAFVVFLCATALTVGIVRNSQTAAPTGLRILSWARSLAVLAVVLATNAGFWAIDRGLGFVVRQNLNLMRQGEAVIALAWIMGIALIIDLVLGVIEFGGASRLTARQAVPALGRP